MNKHLPQEAERVDLFPSLGGISRFMAIMQAIFTPRTKVKVAKSNRPIVPRTIGKINPNPKGKR
jgi:hypothetical protein